MNEAKLTAAGLGAPSSTQLKSRLSRALFELNLKLASCKSGALVQVGAGLAARVCPQLEHIYSQHTCCSGVDAEAVRGWIGHSRAQVQM